MTEVTLRQALPEDLPRMSALWYEHAALLAQQDSRWKLLADAQSVWARAALTWLTKADMCLLVSQEADFLTGFIIAQIDTSPVGFSPGVVGVIRSLAVDAHHYSGGAGRLLVEGVREWCRDQGVSQIVVDLPKRAPIEQAFWRAQGGVSWMERLWIPS